MPPCGNLKDQYKHKATCKKVVLILNKYRLMKKSDIDPMPDFFDRYINLVQEDDLMTAFSKAKIIIEHTDINQLNKIGRKIYAPGKWAIHDIYQHIIDNERIQSYRALCFARNDRNELHGYDENYYAAHAPTEHRTIEELIEELLTVRTSTIQLFNSFDPKVIKNVGICFSRKVPILGLGYMMVGHQIHHLNVIKEKYLPLI